MQTLRADAVVIGAGPGGYVAAIRLAQLGKKTVVVERDEVGGVCLNVGCIPSKALIYAADRYARTREAGEMGIRVERVSLDWPQMQRFKDDVVKKVVGGVHTLLKGNKVEVVKGTGVDRGRRAVRDDDARQEELDGADARTDSLHPNDIRDFLLTRIHRMTPKHAQLLGTALRSFLRFLFLRGETSSDLALAVPTVRQG
jgi:hypothetical protein